MPNYQYTLLQPDGKEVKGVISCENEKELRALVQKNGSIVTDIRDKGGLYGELDISRYPKAKEFGAYCQQIHSILKAGVPIIEALEMLLPTTKNSKLRKATEEVIADINQGITMSDSMNKRQDIFPLVMIQMVKAGEASGKLVEIFNRLAIQFQKEFKLKNSIKRALSYPKIILFTVIAAIVVVCAFVVPMFVKIFEEMDTELPFTTKIFIGLSKLFTTHWYILLAIVVITVVTFKLIKRTDQGLRILTQIKMKLPLIGDLVIKTESANFARIFSTLISSGKDYPDSLEIASNTTDNIFFKEAILRVDDCIKNGNSLAVAMKREVLFPELLLSMATIGESTGNVGGMLENAAEYFEEESETATIRLTGAIQPAVIIFLGIFVGLLVYSIYSPMFSMYASIK